MEPNKSLSMVVILFWTSLFMKLVPMANGEPTAINSTEIKSQNQTVQMCSRLVTYGEIKAILQQHPCVSIESDSGSTSIRRIKRWGDTENKINALNGIINEHRTIINYLLNTSINATFMKGSIDDHHENTGPSFRSWRDLIDLICMTVLFGGLIYLFVFRCGFSPCNRCLITLSRHVLPRKQQKKQNEHQLHEHIRKQIEILQHQQGEQNEKVKTKSMRRKKPVFPSTPSIISDVMQQNHGYVTD